MSAPVPLIRAIRLLALLLQLALPSLGMVADAQHGEGSLHAPVHIESQGSECQGGHPEHCALCQFLRTPVLAATGVQEAAGASPDGTTSPAEPAINPSRERLPSLPRGPPHLS